MTKKLLISNDVGGEEMVQRGMFTCTTLEDDGSWIEVTGLNFIPDIIHVRYNGELISTQKQSLAWIYTPYARCGIRTDSSGVGTGVQGSAYYTDHGYEKGISRIELIEGGFKIQSLGQYGPVRIGDQFEWTAIKYSI